MYVYVFVNMWNGGSTQNLISFSLFLFQESQDRNGDISHTNAENRGIQFINYFFLIKPVVGFI